MANPVGYTQVSDRFGFRAVGEFRCTRKSETLLLAITAIIYALGVCGIVYNALITCFGGLGGPLLFDYSSTGNGIVMIVSFVVLLPLLTLAALIAIKIITKGAVYSYSANDEMLIITDPKGKKTSFYYCDIESVTYEKLTLFAVRQRGFDVFIQTKYRKFRYQYIHSRNKLLRGEKDTPFFILEERAGLRTRRFTDFMGGD